MADTPTPTARHASTPEELQERLALEARGVAFLVVRDGDGEQVLVELVGERLVVGRGEGSDVALPWDEQVSRTHAVLEKVGDAWTVSDDGLSRNGTWVGGSRVSSRIRLEDGDAIAVGNTVLTFRAASTARASAPTKTAESAGGAPDLLTPAQRRVLTALCRPYRDGGIATPASNKEIADELSVSVEAVRTTMRALFSVFGIGELPQNQKRAALAQQALRSGAIARRDL